MNDILKQRLVGALVLIALGVLFWPVIFVEPERGSLDRNSQIAPMPRLNSADIPAPQPLDNIPSVASADALRESAARDEVGDAVAIGKASDSSARTDPRTADADAAEMRSADAETSKHAAADSKPKMSKAAASPPEAEPVVETQTPPPAARVAKAAPQSPSLDEQGIPIAWVLQVASLSTRDKADALTAELISQGHKAYHRAVQRNDGLLYRVFIGPVFEREKLNSIKRTVDARLNVNTIITRYVP
ncbi:MAG: SPOR domain-containing protein [Pseudomonadota bacterium]